MSFGFGVGDLLTIGQFSWNVYKKCKDATGNYAELSSEVSNLHAVIKETEEMTSQQVLEPQQKARLATCVESCNDVLRDLDGILDRYESLGTSASRNLDRLGLGMQDMSGLRLRLISNVMSLNI